MSYARGVLGAAVLTLGVFLTGCGGDTNGVGPDLAAARGNDNDVTSSTAAGQLRLRCEVRTGRRSKISVDGKDLAVGDYRARVQSGSNAAASGLQSSIGDEVEFDFDSARDDIAAGATAIAADFIQTASSPHVTAEILDDAGLIVVSGGADCRVR